MSERGGWGAGPVMDSRAGSDRGKRDGGGPRSIAAPARRAAAPAPLIQRACACGSGAAGGLDDRCEACRGRLVQRAPAGPVVDGGSVAAGSGPSAEDAALGRLGGGRPLDGATRRRMEDGFGADFGAVRVHDDAGAAAAARDLDARAFTHGHDVAFGAGHYRPGTVYGDALLAHELAHVVQQSGGGAPSHGPAPAGLEREADRAAVDVVGGLYGGGARRRPALGRGGLSLRRCGMSAAEPNPLDQRASTRVPTETAQCEHLARLGAMPSPAPAACVAPEPPASSSTSAPTTPRVSAEARAAAETWDGDSSNADHVARRTALEGELTGAIDDWLSEHADEIRLLQARDANRAPIGDFEGACRAAQLVVDRHFGPWITNAARTPTDLARRTSFRPTASGAGRNLFDSGDPGDLAAHGVTGLTATFRALRIISQYSSRARTAAQAHHFSPTRTGTEEQAWLQGVVARYLAAHPSAAPQLEAYSRLAIARSQPSGIWLQTHSDGTDTDRLRRRWSNFQICVHEYLHEVTHPRFRAALGGSEHASEGFTEMFTREVLVPMLPDSVPDDARALVEGGASRPFGVTDAVVIGSYQTPGDYLESLRRAEQTRDSLRGQPRSTGRCSSQEDPGGNNAVKAAYFQGHVELLGLSPTGAGASAGPTRANPDEVAVPQGVSTIAELAVASGLTATELTAANPGLTDGAFPPTVRLPGCREHLVMGYRSPGAAGLESAVESRAQIAAQNGVTEATLDRANPGLAATGWSTLVAGTSVLIPRR